MISALQIRFKFLISLLAISTTIVSKGLIADNNKLKEPACMFSISTDDETRVGALAFLRNTQTLSFHRILLGLEDQRHH